MGVAEGWGNEGADELAGIQVTQLSGSYNPMEAKWNAEKRAFGNKAPPTEDPDAAYQWYEKNPAAISLWVSEADYLIHRVELEVPLNHEADAEAITVIVELSSFNEAPVDIPQVN